MPAIIPVTTPVEEMLAWPFTALHVPLAELPVTDKVVVEPVHTVDAPDTEPALGATFIVIAACAESVPQLLVTLYTIVSVPAIRPVTMPAVVTNALLLVAPHEPPVVACVSDIAAPVHTLAGPDIAAREPALTEIILLVVAVPQLLVTVYTMVSVPTVTPLTIPPEETAA